MEKLRIVEMIDSPSLGGGQTALLLLAKNMDRRQFEVMVGSAGEGPLMEEARRSGLPCLSLSLGKAFRFRTVKEISALLEQSRIDILHTHGGVAGFYGRWAARRSKIPVIVHTLHGIHYLHYQNPLLRILYVWLERRFSRFTDKLICVSQSDIQKAKKYRLAPEDRLFFISNGIRLFPGMNEIEREKMRRAWGWGISQPIIGTIARLHRQKGISVLLEASVRVLRVFPEAKFVVVGEGPLGQKLKKKAHQLGVADKFLFLGAREDAADLLSMFDIFVLPSLWEGLPFVLIEAAAHRMPIVATAVDGVPEIVENGKTGILVPPKNPQMMGEAVIRLLSDKRLAADLAERAADLIPARFPLQRMIEQTQNLYLELTRKKTS